jgi:hypothetical protein
LFSSSLALTQKLAGCDESRIKTLAKQSWLALTFRKISIGVVEIAKVICWETYWGQNNQYVWQSGRKGLLGIKFVVNWRQVWYLTDIGLESWNGTSHPKNLRQLADPKIAMLSKSQQAISARRVINPAAQNAAQNAAVAER